MDVLWFFKQRLVFIQQLFEVSAASYLNRKDKIERGEAPFVPQYSEDSEPPFLAEWLEADESIQTLAHACLSILAASLKLYFKAWQREAGHAPSPEATAKFKEGRWLEAYQIHFQETLAIDFSEAPTPLGLLEEVVLVRNRVQHPESIVLSRTTYSRSDLKKLKHPFFLDESERGLFQDAELSEGTWFMEPSVRASPEKLLEALAQVEAFAKWFEQEAVKRRFGS